MSIFRFIRKQSFPAGAPVLWDFISDPSNLKTITPDKMGFRITTPGLPEKIYPGMMISYRVSPLPGIRITWVTEITHVDEGLFFIDEQRIGPYRIWHHEHRLQPIEGGTLMEDIVTYIPPFGILGRISNQLVIRKKLEEIFDYRERKLAEMFGET